MKKLFYWVYTYLHALFFGFKSADTLIDGNSKSVTDGGTSIEVNNEKKSVYQDLLNGEVTQEVRELRHEMYYAERKSHDYKYVGNGVVKKNNHEFDLGEFENSENLPIVLVQPISRITESSDVEAAIKSYISRANRRYTIDIKRSFYPKFRLEAFANKIVVKDLNEKQAILDIYTTKYSSQFDSVRSPFLNELNRVYMGYKNSDIVTFDELSFTTMKANGEADLMNYKFGNIKFINIVEFDEEYVLKFIADKIEWRNDTVEQFYDERTAKLNEQHAQREGKNIISFEAAQEQGKKDDYDAEEAQKLIDQLSGN
jgi:hypothetical protein